MKILFTHKNFPAHFKHLAIALANNVNNLVMFITNDDVSQIKGIKKIVYKPIKKVLDNCHTYLISNEEALLHGQAAATASLSIRNNKNQPDIIYTHPSGAGIFMKYMFPEVPLVSYCEWYNRAEGADIGFDGNIPDENYRAKIRCSNSNFLIDLYTCDACISPTNWQKSRFPKEFHDKIKVIHDGIDTDKYTTNKETKFIVKDKNLELTGSAEVITYTTRWMDPYMGFAQVFQAVAKLQQKRPNAHFIIAEEDKANYKAPLEETTYSQFNLENLNLDMSRVHVVGRLPLVEYLKFLQISSVHVYSTYPYILSNSMLEAMSAGCCVVASNTAPVVEVVKDNYNGLLFDFFNVNELVEKIEYALVNKKEMQKIRTNARKTIVENYGLDKILPQQINFLNSLVTHK